MHIGIDFGTSYSAAAAVLDGKLQLIRFGDATQFRTAVFFPERVPSPDEFQLTPAMEAEVDVMIRAGRMQHAGLSDVQLRKDAIRVVRRQWMEEQVRSARPVTGDLQQSVIGEEAVQAYLEEGTGHLIESPKSMFGYRMDAPVRQTVVNIAAHILEHVRLTATRQLGITVRGAVIGRPVEFRSSMGAQGGIQALELLREAAQLAGFDEIAFVEEPVAAAMHYHRAIDRRQRVLIVDIGGGTTDLAYAELGAGMAPRIHRSWGVPVGGTDLDLGVNLQSFMPLFGKDEAAVPAHNYVDAASVQILPRQRDFRKKNFRMVREPFGSRLRSLQQLGATTQLNRLAEMAKIRLGSDEHCAVDFGFIESGLALQVQRADFLEAAAGFIEKFNRLLIQARNDIGTLPDCVFLTGGSSQAADLQRCVRRHFPGIPVVEGDPSLGVVSGLATVASDIEHCVPTHLFPARGAQ